MKPARTPSPELAGRCFPVAFARLKSGTQEQPGMLVRFDDEGFPWLDVPPGGSYEIGGEASVVVRVDPMAWIK